MKNNKKIWIIAAVILAVVIAVVAIVLGTQGNEPAGTQPGGTTNGPTAGATNPGTPTTGPNGTEGTEPPATGTQPTEPPATTNPTDPVGTDPTDPTETDPTNPPETNPPETDPPATEHKHNYTGKTTKKATCNEKGEKTYTCSCGASYTESIATTDHQWTEWKNTGNWRATRHCETCSEKDEKKAKQTQIADPKTGISWDGVTQIIYTYEDGTTGTEPVIGATYEWAKGEYTTYEGPPEDTVGRVLGEPCEHCGKKIEASHSDGVYCVQKDYTWFCYCCGAQTAPHTCHTCEHYDPKVHYCTYCGNEASVCIRFLSGENPCPHCGEIIPAHTCHICDEE